MSLLSRYLSVVIAMCCFTFIYANPATAQDMNSPLPQDPNLVTGKLDNGLTYFIRSNHKPANKVELRLVVKAGSIVETDEQLGLAHFMEHMNFNGTKNFQKNELVSYLQSIGVQFGADLNAYTSFDQTVYILPIPTDKPDNLETGFQIIEDWAHNALLTDKDVDEERGVVLEESRLGKGADDRMLKKYFPKLAEGSLYAGRLPIGKDEVLKNFKYDKVRDFYNDWYRPDLQAVIIVGDIDVPTATKMLNKHFGRLKNPAREKERKYVSIAPRKAPEAMVVTDKEATNPIVLIKFPYQKKEPENTLADYRKNVIKALVLTMVNRRLSDLAQGATPPFLFAGVGTDDLVHGYEGLEVEMAPGNEGIEKPLKALTAELLKVEQYGFSETELELARKELMSGVEKHYKERNTTESREYVEEYIRVFLDGEAFPGIENEYKYQQSMLKNIFLPELNKTAQRFFSDRNTFTLVTAPDRPELKLPSSEQLLKMSEDAFRQKIAMDEEPAVAYALMATFPPSGLVVNMEAEQGFEANTYTLTNGIEVTVKPTNYKSDEILIKGVKKGGTGNYGVADRSNVKYATEVMDAMGYSVFTPVDIQHTLAGKKVEANMVIGDVTDEINGSSTVKDFETLLQLIYLQITSPRKDSALFTAYKKKQMGMIQFIAANPQAAFGDTTFKVLYNNNPLARSVIPTAADYDQINLNRAMEIYRNEFSGADGYHFFIIGNIPDQFIVPLMERYFGSLPSKGKVPAFKDNGVRPISGNREMKVYKGKEQKAMILEIYHGEIPYSEDLALKTQALAEVLNIKVIEELREKMGAIYGGGFNGAVTREPYSRYSMQLYLPCGPENVDKLMSAAHEEIAKLKTSGPDKKDLDKVKSQWKEQYKTELKENRFWLAKMESAIFWGADRQRALNFEAYVDKLTPADIQETAKTIFSGNNQFISVLYPER